MVAQNLQQLSTNTFTVAKWVVSPTLSNGTHTTITSALASASSGDTVFVRDGTYTENFTLPAGITLTALTGDATTPSVTVIGKITMTAAGTSTISNIQLQTNSDYALVISGASICNLTLQNCYLNCTNNTGINFTNSNASSSLLLNNCRGDIGTTGITCFTNSSAGSLKIFYSRFTNSGASTTPSTSSTAQTQIFWCAFLFPLSCSSTGTINIFESTYDYASTLLTTSGTGLSYIWFSYLSSGSASLISIGAGTSVKVSNNIINSNNTNVITGAGILFASENVYYGSSNGINTTTQNPLSSDVNCYKITNKTGSYAVQNLDNIIAVDTNGGPYTITLPAPAISGEVHTIKDSTGHAAANNLTVAGNGANIDGSVSQIIDANYAAITVFYNGTQWNII